MSRPGYIDLTKRKRDLNAPITRELVWLREEARRKHSEQKIAWTRRRYREDPWAVVSGRRRARIFIRDGWRCRVCGRRVTLDLPRFHPRRAELGHIVAKSKGGPLEDWNLATLCRECNRLDGANHGVPIQLAAF